MKLKERIKTYNFWVSLSSAIFLLLKVLGTQFGFKVDESLFSDLITSLCGILVILGIIVPPTNKTSSQESLKIEQESFDESKNEINQRADDITPTETITQENEIQENVKFEEKSTITDNNAMQIDCTESENLNSDAEEVCTSEEIANLNGEVISNKQDSIIDESHEDNNFNLQNQFAQILEEHVSLFGDDINSYIEVLQNQINQLKSK